MSPTRDTSPQSRDSSIIPPAVEARGAHKESATDLARKLRTLVLARFTFLASMALLALLVVLSASEPIPATLPLLRIAGVGLLLSGVHLLIAASRKISLVAQAYIQFAGDLLLATALVYSTGGANSAFSMIYLIVIAAAAVILRRRAGIRVAQIAWLLYAATVVGIYQGWFGAGTGTGIDPSDPLAGGTSIGRLTYVLFVHLVGFYGVATLTSMLSNQAAKAERDLAVATGDLEDLEIYHRDVVESMSSGLVLVDLKDRVININRTGRQILGFKQASEQAKLVDLGLLDEDHWQRLRSAAGGERIRDEAVLRAQDGSLRTVGFSVGEISDSDDRLRGYSIVFQELTEWRRLQMELGVKQRMAAVGELAAGLAHEIGNPLAAISGSVQMLRASGEADSADRKLLDIVLKESQRLDRTIKGFLKFAKPHERNDQRFDVCTLVRENLALLENSEEVSKDHELKAVLDPESLFLVADRDQIVQVFWNLARNALRAMPNGGRFTVRGQFVAAWSTADIRTSSETTHYSLRFEDSGEGMTDEQRHSLFHPFTSHQGGMGIGMAIVYRVVDAHDGQINVESELGTGTAVEIRLPI